MATALRPVQEELAAKLVREFNLMLPALEAVAQAVARNSKLKVRMAKPGSASRTDGQIIYVQVPKALAVTVEHNRTVCDRRDENFQLACPACYRRELILRNMFHEIGHCLHNSVNFTTLDTPRRKRTEVSLSWVSPDRELEINKMLVKSTVPYSYVRIAQMSGKYFPILQNALEDIRIEAAISAARPGAHLMFKAGSYRLIRKGLEGSDTQATDATDDNSDTWIEAAPNVQVICGMIFAAMGTDLHGYLHQQVIDDIDGRLWLIVQDAKAAADAGEIYRIACNAYFVLTELGYLESPPPPPQEPAEQDEDGQAQSGVSDEKAEEPDGSGGSPDSDTSSDEPQPADGSDDESTGAQGTGDESLTSEQPGLGDTPEPDAPEAPTDESDNSAQGAATAPDDDTSDDDTSAAGSDGSDEASAADDGDNDTGASGDEGPDSTEEPGSDHQPGEQGPSMGTDGYEDNDSPSGEGYESDRDADPQVANGGPTEEDHGPDDDVNRWGNLIMAEPDEISTAVDKALGHDENGTVDRTEVDQTGGEVTPTVLSRANEMAYRPSEFEKLGDRVGGVAYFTWEADNRRWVNSSASGAIDSDAYSLPVRYVTYVQDIKTPEPVLSKSLFQLRLVLEANARGKQQTNLKSGKINPSVLGRRAALDDPRLFRKRSLPKKRDYYVVLCMDCSGSTASGNILEDEKKAVFAQAELLARLGIKFEIFGVTGFGNSTGETLVVGVMEIKSGDEPWNTTTQDRLASVKSNSSNLDGHSLQVAIYRAMKHRATDRIIMYYTDGEMPSSNYREELEVLQRGIATCERYGITLMGVGLRTDSPRAHGLDTVRIDSVDDVPKAIEHLGKRIRA